MRRKRFSLDLSSTVLLALLLTACGGEETATNLPSTNVPPITVEVTSTEDMSGTQTTATEDLTTTPAVPVTGEDNTSRVINLLDLGLWNQNSEQVGEVEDFVLDLDNTRISYLVAETGGFLDVGDKTILIPWDSVQLQNASENTGGESALILLSDPEFLNNAPDVDLETILPGMGQPAGDWDVDIRTFWDTGSLPGGTQSTPAAGGTAETATSTAGTAILEMTATTTTGGTGQGLGETVQGVILASDVLGSTITIGGGQGQSQVMDQGQGTAMPDTTATAGTGTGTDIATATAATSGGTGSGTENAATVQGTVEDLIVDPATGDIQYLVIRTDEDDTRWIPVPIGFLRWDATNNAFILMINANALQNAPAFQEDQFPDTSSSGWDSEFSTFWQNNTDTGIGTSTGVTASTATPTP